jgi:hypothetical protein
MTQKMNPEIKAKWVAALRSGRYEQGQHRLKSETGEYCCLGVLCSVIKAKKWTDNELLPAHVQVQVGAIRGDFRVSVNGKDTFLSNLNDKGIPFNEIANIIEEQL